VACGNVCYRSTCILWDLRLLVQPILHESSLAVVHEGVDEVVHNPGSSAYHPTIAGKIFEPPHVGKRSQGGHNGQPPGGRNRDATSAFGVLHLGLAILLFLQGEKEDGADVE
jgi:hypothetical protein